MNCPTNETLERKALGFLEEAQEVSAHVAGCAGCTAALAALAGDHAAIARAAKDVALPTLRNPRRRFPWRPFAAAAACGLVALAIFWVSGSRKPARSVLFASKERATNEHVQHFIALATEDREEEGLKADPLDALSDRSFKATSDGSRREVERTMRTTVRPAPPKPEPVVAAPDPKKSPVPSPPPPPRVELPVVRTDQPEAADEPLPDPAVMIFRDHGTNPVVETSKETQSTFALDVDTASYSLVRNYLRRGQLPPPAAVRTEEFLNSFRYADEPPPKDDFAVRLEVAPSPFQDGRHLLRVAVLAREVSEKNRKDAVLTFVIDVSGSMAQENRLELVKRSLRFLVDRLRPADKVGIVVYGTNAYKLLEPTAVARKDVILPIIDGLRTEGSTNAGAGLLEGYRMADLAFDPKRTNRVVLCSDGVANTGVTQPDAILKRVEDHAAKGVALSTLGFGMGNYNDALMEKLANKGNGNYAYIDDFDEAKKIFSEKLTGMMEIVAADAKVQVEFDARTVATFRLLGYENRHVANKDFRNDKIDAGEVGAGHRVNAVYEIALKPGQEGRLATVRLRYRDPETKEVPEHQESISVGQIREKPSASWRMAAAVGRFAEILRGKEGSMAAVLEIAERAAEDLDRPQDALEFVDLVRAAKSMKR